MAPDGLRAGLATIRPHRALHLTATVARVKIRSGSEVVDRCRELAGALQEALARLPAGEDDLAVVEAIWRGERLGTLLWALRLAELPPYDRPFEHVRLLDVPLEKPRLRDEGELESARETARLWHWRARMVLLEDDPSFELPAPWRSCRDLVASVASRGHGLGLLPAPVGDDFPALGFQYRWSTPRELAELRSIAYERHHALCWLCDSARVWGDIALDT
jgi:hypothetical protein